MKTTADKIKKELNADAKTELRQCEAVRLLLHDEQLAAEIHISGMTVGLCNIQKLIPALEYHMKEIEKHIEGKENEWY